MSTRPRPSGIPSVETDKSLIPRLFKVNDGKTELPILYTEEKKFKIHSLIHSIHFKMWVLRNSLSKPTYFSPHSSAMPSHVSLASWAGSLSNTVFWTSFKCVSFSKTSQHQTFLPVGRDLHYPCNKIWRQVLSDANKICHTKFKNYITSQKKEEKSFWWLLNWVNSSGVSINVLNQFADKSLIIKVLPKQVLHSV